MRRRLHSGAVLLLPLIVALSGCAGTVSLEPADDANDPLCAEIIVRLPEQLGDAPLRATNAQATGAWGNPVSVILRCGVDVPGPSTLECVTVGDIDWLIDDSDAPRYRFTTYGRVPATEVIVDATAASGDAVLSALAEPIGYTARTAECLG